MSNKNKIRLALVDDHQIIIDGLIAILKEDSEVVIVATANSAKELLELLQQIEIDILLSDVVMENMGGNILAKEIKKQFPSVKIIALSMISSGEIVEEMVNNTAIDGYLLKQTGKEELLTAIKKVYRGEQYFQQKVLDELKKQADLNNQFNTANITEREKEIIILMEKDLSNKEIAERLEISVRTVETHRKNIFSKTGTNNPLSLIKWAYLHKIVSR